MIKIYTDGATEGYNGKLGTIKKVGLGVYIPALHLKLSKRVDGMSNNEAEFKALIWALEIVTQKKIKKAIFYLDSQVVVNRANGRTITGKNLNIRMDNFQIKVLNLLKKIESYEVIWIPREENQIADRLSKKKLKH